MHTKAARRIPESATQTLEPIAWFSSNHFLASFPFPYPTGRHAHTTHTHTRAGTGNERRGRGVRTSSSSHKTTTTGGVSGGGDAAPVCRLLGRPLHPTLKKSARASEERRAPAVPCAEEGLRERVHKERCVREEARRSKSACRPPCARVWRRAHFSLESAS